MRFFDDNTRSWWTPVTGGANVPALNDLLAPHGVVIGDAIMQGSITAAGHHLQVSTVLAALPCSTVVVLLLGGGLRDITPTPLPAALLRWWCTMRSNLGCMAAHCCCHAECIGNIGALDMKLMLVVG